MIARLGIVAGLLGVLASCAPPPVPDAGRGVGFGDQFTAEQRARDAALTGSNLPGPPPVVGAPLTPASGSAEATAAQTTAILAATRTGSAEEQARAAALAGNSGVAPLEASPANAPPPVLNSAGISSENDFDAVSGQRSIESDAARLAANRQQYQVIQPEALPERRGGGPNIVAFALQTSHPRGASIYPRSFTRQSVTQRACAAYAADDQAQIDFLASGGPRRDRKGVDPDGDGYACNWDPAPFRRAAQAG